MMSGPAQPREDASVTNPGRQGALLVPPCHSPILARGIDRIVRKSPYPPDRLHGPSPDDPALSGYEWVLALDAIDTSAGDSPEDDAWAVAVEPGAPARVTIRAATGRARLFAMYHIAKCLEMKKPPAEWAIRRVPTLAKRYAWITAGCTWSDVCRPDWFDRDIGEIPEMGFNGVILTLAPTHGTSIGRQTLPLKLGENGVEVDRFKLPAFKDMFDRLKTYGLDISLMHQAFIPPQYTIEEVRAHYDGKRTIGGLEALIEKTSCELAAEIFKHLPQVDSLMFHSLECEWRWGRAVGFFPSKDDEASARALDAYLRGQTRACEEAGKDLMFWAHVSGISSRQMRAMYGVLERHPSVMTIIDHVWPNDSWPHAPVMGFVSDDIRRTVTSSRWGMSIVTTDGEPYGSGALPTAWPGPNAACARTARELGAELGFIRLNEVCLTTLGTLGDINAIQVLAAGEEWWTPARSQEELWQEWSSRRFGKAAAPAVASALQKSETIIRKGFCAGRIPVIHHGSMAIYGWLPGQKYGAWGVFARPGEQLVDLPWDELVCAQIRPWQVSSRGLELEDFLRDSAEAEAAAREGLCEIESVREKLAPEDYDYLYTCFEQALPMLEAIRRTAVGAHASARFLGEQNDSTRRDLEAACAELEACADRIETEYGIDFFPTPSFMKVQVKGKFYEGYGAPIALRAIAEAYRKTMESAS